MLEKILELPIFCKNRHIVHSESNGIDEIIFTVMGEFSKLTITPYEIKEFKIGEYKVIDFVKFTRDKEIETSHGVASVNFLEFYSEGKPVFVVSGEWLHLYTDTFDSYMFIATHLACRKEGF